MALDRVMIGARIRKIREKHFEETREQFADRCDLTERHIGQIERGDFLLSMSALDKIASSTGIPVDFILYGDSNNRNLNLYDSLITIIDRSNKEELKIYYKCINSIKSYTNKFKQ